MTCREALFCVEYLESMSGVTGGTSLSGRPKVDYKEVLKPDEFEVFSRLREWRKGVAEREGVPVYTVLTNELESGRFSGDNQAFDLSSQSARCSANPTHWSVSRRNFLKLANSARTVTTSTARMYWDFFLPRNT